MSPDVPPDQPEGARLRIDAVADDPSTLALVGEVDPHSAPLLEAALAERLAAGDDSIRLDVSGLDFIDSSGLRVLVEAHRALGGEPGSLRLTGVSPTFARLLEMTGLDEHLTIDSTS